MLYCYEMQVYQNMPTFTLKHVIPCVTPSPWENVRHAVQPLHRLIHHDFSDSINRSNHSHGAVSWWCFSTRSTLCTYRAEHHCHHYLCHCRRGGPTLSHLLYHAHKASGKSSGTHTYHHRNHNSLHHTSHITHQIRIFILFILYPLHTTLPQLPLSIIDRSQHVL